MLLLEDRGWCQTVAAQYSYSGFKIENLVAHGEDSFAPKRFIYSNDAFTQVDVQHVGCQACELCAVRLPLYP